MITPGKNIALKVPAYRWAETVAFYRDRVGLDVVREIAADADRGTDATKESGPASVAFRFGEMTLWIDRVPAQSQTDVWLELFTDDPDLALSALGAPLRDELEPLAGVTGHWTSDPAGVVLLLRREESSAPSLQEIP